MLRGLKVTHLALQWSTGLEWYPSRDEGFSNLWHAYVSLLF